MTCCGMSLVSQPTVPGVGLHVFFTTLNAQSHTVLMRNIVRVLVVVREPGAEAQRTK